MVPYGREAISGRKAFSQFVCFAFAPTDTARRLLFVLFLSFPYLTMAKRGDVSGNQTGLYFTKQQGNRQ